MKPVVTEMKQNTAFEYLIKTAVCGEDRQRRCNKHISGISKEEEQDKGREQTVQENVPQIKGNLENCTQGEHDAKWVPAKTDEMLKMTSLPLPPPSFPSNQFSPKVN